MTEETPRVAAEPDDAALLPERASAEMRLLLACAGCAGSARARIEHLLRGPLDWDAVLLAARTHGMVPLLYRALDTVDAEGVPEAAMGRLRQGSRACATRNTFLAAELRRVVDILRAGGIPAVPLKGPTLAMLLYGDVHLRQFWDLDILVRPGDARRALSTLAADSYRPRHPAGRLATAAQLRLGFEYNLARRDGAANVQLHWQLSGGGIVLRMRDADVWGRLEGVRLAGAMLPALPAEEMLLFLCVHGSRHGWRRIQWVCDVAHLLRVRPGMDWAYVQALARAYGAERMLHLGMLMARDLLGAVVPDPLAGGMDVRAVRMLARRATRWLLGGEPRTTRVILGEVGFQWGLRERLRDRPADLASSVTAFALERMK